MKRTLKLFDNELYTNPVMLKIGDIRSNPHLSEDRFSPSQISKMSASITRKGILFPLKVRKNGSKYELIDGGRRLLAAKMCGLTELPCVVCEISDRNYEIFSIIEDIKHRDHYFFEEAEMLEKLIKFYGMTQEDAAEKLGRAQSTIANKLRLLRLTPPERRIIGENFLSERHSRAFLRLASPEERIKVIERVVSDRLNVEQTELLVDEVICGKISDKNSVQHEKQLHDAVVFVHSFNKMLDSVKTQGIRVKSVKIEDKGFIEYRVRMAIE